MFVATHSIMILELMLDLKYLFTSVLWLPKTHTHTHTYHTLLYLFSITSHGQNLILHVYIQVIHWQRLSSDENSFTCQIHLRGAATLLHLRVRVDQFMRFSFLEGRQWRKSRNSAVSSAGTLLLFVKFPCSLTYLFCLTFHSEGDRESYHKQFVAVFLVAL